MRQLDLFNDSPRTIALNMLREAILARNAPGAGTALERLLNLAPGHERASDARTLIAVLEAPAPEGPDEGIEWLPALEREWRPAAMRLLRTGDSRGLGLKPRPPSASSTEAERRVKQDPGGMIHYPGIHLNSAAILFKKPGPPQVGGATVTLLYLTIVIATRSV